MAGGIEDDAIVTMGGDGGDGWQEMAGQEMASQEMASRMQPRSRFEW